MCARSPFLQEAKKKKKKKNHIPSNKRDKKEKKKKTTAIILCLAPIKKRERERDGVVWGWGRCESDFLIRNFLCSKRNFYSHFFLSPLSSWCCWCYLFFYILKTHWLTLSLSLFFRFLLKYVSTEIKKKYIHNCCCCCC